MLISKKLNIKVLILRINGNKWFPASSPPEKPSPEDKVKFFARLILRPKNVWHIVENSSPVNFKGLENASPGETPKKSLVTIDPLLC
jgi:hypothetical protein